MQRHDAREFFVQQISPAPPCCEDENQPGELCDSSGEEDETDKWRGERSVYHENSDGGSLRNCDIDFSEAVDYKDINGDLGSYDIDFSENVEHKYVTTSRTAPATLSAQQLPNATATTSTVTSAR